MPRALSVLVLSALVLGINWVDVINFACRFMFPGEGGGDGGWSGGGGGNGW